MTLIRLKKWVPMVFICSFVFIASAIAGNEKPLTVEGIIAIKEGHGDILVRPDKGNDKRLRVKESTTITRNGKPATYDDLQARDRIVAKFGSDRVIIELHATGS